MGSNKLFNFYQQYQRENLFLSPRIGWKKSKNVNSYSSSRRFFLFLPIFYLNARWIRNSQSRRHKRLLNDWVTKGVTRKRFKCPLLPLKMIFHLSKTCLSKLFHSDFFFSSLLLPYLFVQTRMFPLSAHTYPQTLTRKHSTRCCITLQRVCSFVSNYVWEWAVASGEWKTPPSNLKVEKKIYKKFLLYNTN